jgi:surfeit locus 1 family protein
VHLQLGRRRFEPRLLTTVITVALLVLLVSLGMWQAGRARAKDRIAEAHAIAGAAPALDLGDLSTTAMETTTEMGALVHRAALAEGRYDKAHQFLLDNQVHRGVAGYHVLTPMWLSGDKRVVLVNRGWVPVGPSRLVLPDLPTPVARQVTSGVLAATPVSGILLGEAGYGTGTWPRVVQRVELGSIAADLDAQIVPLLLLLDPQAPAGFERDWRPVRGVTAERHRAYAFQWFALACALLVIYVVVNTHPADRP